MAGPEAERWRRLDGRLGGDRLRGRLEQEEGRADGGVGPGRALPLPFATQLRAVADKVSQGTSDSPRPPRSPAFRTVRPACMLCCVCPSIATATQHGSKRSFMTSSCAASTREASRKQPGTCTHLVGLAPWSSLVAHAHAHHAHAGCACTCSGRARGRAGGVR